MDKPPPLIDLILSLQRDVALVGAENAARRATRAAPCVRPTSRTASSATPIPRVGAAAKARHLDETGFGVGGKTRWLRRASTAYYTHCSVGEHRGDVPGTMAHGVIVRDHFTPYCALNPSDPPHRRAILRWEADTGSRLTWLTCGSSARRRSMPRSTVFRAPPTSWITNVASLSLSTSPSARMAEDAKRLEQYRLRLTQPDDKIAR